MYARVIQFSFILNAELMAMILCRLFGGDRHLYNVIDEEDSHLSFTVADVGIASLITAMGDFKMLGMLIRFSDPAALSSTTTAAGAHASSGFHMHATQDGRILGMHTPRPPCASSSTCDAAPPMEAPVLDQYCNDRT